MIYDLRYPEQEAALRTEMCRQDMLYGRIFLLRLEPGLVMLIEPWVNRAAVP